MAKPDIFRKVALDRLGSPDQLDELMQVATPKGWLALTGLAALLVVAIAWSVVGSIPERIAAQAILLRSGGVYEVVAQSGGLVSDLSIRVGDTIREGQVIARLSQPELSEQVRNARSRVAELEGQYRRVGSFVDRDRQLQAASQAQRRTNLEQSIQASEATLAALTERIANEERLVQQGLMTRQNLLRSRQEHETVKERIRADRSQLVQLNVESLQAGNQKEQELLASRNQLHEAERNLEKLENDLRLQSEVTSPYTGRVLEVMAEQGGLVDRGEPIMTVSLAGKAVKNLEAVVYVPSLHGKKIKPGMEIQIVPSTVKKEEYGYLLGRVTYASDFPSTPQGMQRVLKNAQLVTALSGQDAPYEVHADLIPDAASATQYRWSSSSGPPIRIQSGTLADANIVVERRRPILLVVPQLRRFLGIGAAGPADLASRAGR
ncbi:MAG TPA: NHLP bacteriocin system secretion protein [Longimicrobium sp.]|jgi:HlyD family secretion protein